MGIWLPVYLFFIVVVLTSLETWIFDSADCDIYGETIRVS